MNIAIFEKYISQGTAATQLRRGSLFNEVDGMKKGDDSTGETTRIEKSDW